MNGDKTITSGAARLAPRRFGDLAPRSAGTTPLMRLHPSHGHQPVRPLPAPTGPYPYHLSLDHILPAAGDAASRRLVLHMVGDTGGIMTPLPQMNVARQMELDRTTAAGDGKAAFFYHLGDVVYFYGEAENYFPQFYEPYARYDAPIVAIPGNHDGDLSPQMEAQGIASLAAFVRNFCAPIPHHTADAHDATRSSMTQPNVYWTLETPLATFVGLYTNVPEGGSLDQDQVNWLVEELKNAPTERPLFVTMHHPIYSLDDFHSGSTYMAGILDDAVRQAGGRIPDAVFAGHVHNYQRFTRTWEGRQVPFIVAGGGGYHNLHRLTTTLAAHPDLQTPPAPVPETSDVVFESFCDTMFGFLRLELTPGTLQGTYVAVPGFQDPAGAQATHVDGFSLDLATHRVTTIAPSQGEGG